MQSNVTQCSNTAIRYPIPLPHGCRRFHSLLAQPKRQRNCESARLCKWLLVIFCGNFHRSREPIILYSTARIHCKRSFPNHILTNQSQRRWRQPIEVRVSQLTNSPAATWLALKAVYRGSAMGYRLNSQIPQCTCPISHNAQFRTEMCTFLFWMVHYGICDWCIRGFVRLVNCEGFEDYETCHNGTIYIYIYICIYIFIYFRCVDGEAGGSHGLSSRIGVPGTNWSAHCQAADRNPGM